MKHDESNWDILYSNMEISGIPFPSGLAEQFARMGKDMFPSCSTFLEAGSGSGEISAYLAHKGYCVTLLDTSRVALDVSKRLFAKYNLLGEFREGDLFHMPFANESFDCVWNSGVMEHFSDEELVEGLREMKRVSKGKVIVMVPSAWSIFYRIGKWSLKKEGLWPYGQEFPKTTLKPLFQKAGFHDIKEDFLQVYMSIDWMKYIGKQGGIWNKYMLKGRQKLLTRYAKNPQGWEQNMLMKRFFGYLLISIGN